MSQPGLAGGSGGVDAGLGGGGADDAVLHNIGVMCQHAGVFFDVVSVQPREALRMHGTALDSAIAWHSENNPNVAACYGNIWNVYRAQGKYDEAFVEYQKGLKIEIRVHGCEHDNVANSYNNISNVYSAQGDDENALLQFQKLTIRMRLLGCDAWPPPTRRSRATSDATEVAMSYNNIGAFCQLQDDYKNALLQHHKSLEIKLLVYGQKHPLVAETYHNIGTVYMEQARAKKHSINTENPSRARSGCTDRTIRM